MRYEDKLYNAARRKLIIWCLAAVVIISIGFDVPAYIIAIRQINNTHNQLVADAGPDYKYITELRKEIRKENHSNNLRLEVIETLVVVQGLILVFGIAGSYVFVKQILRPIKRAHEAQAEFTANANHQMRTPLAVIKAELENARLHNDYSPQTTKAVYASITEEVNGLQAITEHLLLQSQAVQSDQTGSKSVTTIRQATQLANDLARLHGVQCTTTIRGNDLPLTYHEMYMLLDVLFDNSKKYAGVTNVKSKLSTTNDKSIVVLSYEDNGHGIDPGLLEHVLERGARGPKTSQVKGNGLGLSIIARMVKDHHGTITATSSPKGARFTISLPTIKR